MANIGHPSPFQSPLRNKLIFSDKCSKIRNRLFQIDILKKSNGEMVDSKDNNFQEIFESQKLELNNLVQMIPLKSQ